MGDFYVDRSNPNRGALLLPLGGTRDKPNIGIMFRDPATQSEIDKAELSELIIAECEKKGLSEKQAALMLEGAEEGYEYRMKVSEASEELRMRLREIERYPNLRNGGIKPHRKSTYKH